MIKGTTPKHTFTIPLETSELASIRIIYAQDDTQLFVKEMSDCVLEGKTISVTLTQAETLRFDDTKLAQIQLRVKTKSGEVLSSDVLVVYVGKCLDTEVMV